MRVGAVLVSPNFLGPEFRRSFRPKNGDGNSDEEEAYVMTYCRGPPLGGVGGFAPEYGGEG